MILQSTITCPYCATAKSETMPTDACQFFYVCTACAAKLQPKEGDCCVFWIGAVSSDSGRTIGRNAGYVVLHGLADGR